MSRDQSNGKHMRRTVKTVIGVINDDRAFFYQLKSQRNSQQPGGVALSSHICVNLGPCGLRTPCDGGSTWTMAASIPVHNSLAINELQ